MAKLVSKTYGDALFELAVSENNLAAITDEVHCFLDILHQNDDMNTMLSGDGVSKEEKWEFIKNVFDGRLSDIMMGFLNIAIEKGRSSDIESILDYFSDRSREYNKIGVAHITSAVSLTDAQKKQIKDRLLQVTDFVDYETEYEVDEKLIGGLVIRIGDRVFDSSVKNRIEKMQRSLTKIQLN